MSVTCSTLQLYLSIEEINKNYYRIKEMIVKSNDLDVNRIKVNYKMTKRKLDTIVSATTLIKTLEKIGECDAYDKFHTIEFLACCLNNKELNDLVNKHKRLLEDTDYDRYLEENKYATEIRKRANENRINYSLNRSGVSETTIALLCKKIGPDKWKPLARHLKDNESQFVFDETMISEIDSKNSSTELKLREVMKIFLEMVDVVFAREELLRVLMKIKRRDLAKILEEEK